MRPPIIAVPGSSLPLDEASFEISAARDGGISTVSQKSFSGKVCENTRVAGSAFRLTVCERGFHA